MSRIVLLILLSHAFVSSTTAQQLFIPRDVNAAFTRHTRSADGRPGAAYWQNHGRYNIVMNVVPPNRTIRGTETITYFNNSPDTLRALSFKLLLNIHKPGAPRDFPAGADYLTDGITVDSFQVANTPAIFPHHDGVFTNATARLPKPVLPHDSVQMALSWHFTISLQSGREGMIDSSTWFLAYFYPRIAVHDDVSGWDRMNFMDSHEFYSDFNDYDVTINVPPNYLVWGTGTLQSASQVLQPTYADRLQRSFTSDSTIRIANRSELTSKKVTAQQPVNSWRFTAHNVPDATFALSDHFAWDGGSTIVDEATGRRASVQAAYNDSTSDFPYMVGFGQHALHWLSRNWPGIPYPYEKSTIVQGYAGMEYPMMVNDETYADTIFSRFVADHEIAHTYMPFYMGINETRYGFMDEGWATTFEYLIGLSELSKEKADGFFKNFRVASWINDAGSDEQIPIVTPGDALTGQGFGNNEYGKASLGYLAMKDLLGDQLFKKCLHEYMSRWNEKHPLPWDFFNTFNNVAGRNLNWFWNRWFFGTGYIDLSLRSVNHVSGGYDIVIDNPGGFPAPTNLIISYSDGSAETRHLTPAVWEADPATTTMRVRTSKTIASAQLDGGIFMDADTSNNKK